MFNKVVLGGTFNILHRGHKEILNVAFKIGRSVAIGLTADEFANRFRPVEISKYEERKENLTKFIENFNKEYAIIEIHDSYGIATIDPEIDCIVVSEETLLRAEEINAIRFKKGLSKLTMVVVPILLGSDGKAISGERILRGEIDADGKVL
ncbi:MAG: phosphopantetheine adenylyltransferase [Candidatus Altiarchaeales archaeon HGW-Altiarchaeales-3]|nr:MAG: phosphopantetheine adenylyltransferase [Candidatus Altiarchaeales archaeon HGW-Altiarchaeales-3]